MGNKRERGGNNLPRASFERVGRRFKCLGEHKRERGEQFTESLIREGGKAVRAPRGSLLMPPSEG